MSSSEINSESHGSSKRTLAILLVVALVAGMIFPLASASETPGEPELNPDMNCLVPRIVPTEPEVSITQGVPGGSTFVNPESHVLTPGQYARDEVTPTRGGSPAPVPTPCYIPPNPTPQGVLWDNGPLVNEPGAGNGGADASALQTALSMNVYGFGAQNALGYHIADDFDMTDSGTIDSITFYSYQTGSTTTSTIDGVYVQIWDGAPDGGGAVIWGDMVTNCLTTTGWSNIYRVLDTNLLDTNRPIMEIVADTSGLTLTPGTYWVDVSFTGTLGSGPWMPPITINTQTTTGNALQWTGAWAPMMDSGTATQQGIPFIIDGDVSGGGLDDILIYADDAFHTFPNTYVDQALNALGLPYTPYYDGDYAGFEADLTGGGPWDLVIYSGENYGPPNSVFDEMNTYASGGGNLICCDWDISARPGHPLWTTMGFTYQSEYGAPPPVYWWDPGHHVFNTPETVPEFTLVADPGYGTNGHRVEPLPGFDPLAGYTTPGPDPNEAALIFGNGGRTIYKSWLDGGNDANQDGDGKLDGVELWIDMISNFGEPADYAFDATPPTQTRFGWTGDYVDHYITIQNTGLENDVYLPMFGDFDWRVKFWNLDRYGEKDEETWWIGPVAPGDTIDFIAEVRMPSVTPGEWDQVPITITSHGDRSVINTVNIITRTSMPTPFYDDFEEAGTSGNFGQWNDGPPLGEVHNVWTRDDPTMAGVNDMTAWPPSTYSMYTRWGATSATTCMMHMDGIPTGIVSCAIQRGDSAFSEDPDSGEDLVVEYRSSGRHWNQLGIFPGDGASGETFYPLYVLPPDALHPRFQLRFRQLDGSGDDFDYWHIDNVYIGPPAPVFDLVPPAQNGEVLPGHIIDYDLTINNNALHPDFYDLSINGNNWPTQILNNVGSGQITQLGPISPGDFDTFKIRVQVPPGTPFLDTDTVNIEARSQLDPAIRDVSTATTTAAEPEPILTPPTDSFGAFIGTLVQYPLTLQNGAVSPDSFEIQVTGNAWPTTAYLPHFTDDFGSGDISSWTVVDEGTSSGPSNWNAAGGNIRQTTNIHTPWASCGQDFPGSYVWNGDTGWNDYIMQTRWQSTDNDGIGIMTRYADQNNYYRFHWSADGAWDKDRTKPGTQYRVLDVNDNGVWSVLASDNVAYTGSQWYDIEMKNIGDRLQVYIDDTLIFDVTDNTHSNGAIALYNWGNSGSYFDDVVVYTPSPPTIGPIAPGGTVDFIVVVEIPPGTAPGTVDVVDIIASSTTGPAYQDVTTITTTAAEPNPILTPPTSNQNAFPLWVVDYTLNIQNGAIATDSFDVYVFGETWTTTVWDAAGVTPITQIGPLAPGASQDFIVRVTVPAGPYGAFDTAFVMAQSQFDGCYNDMTTITTTIVPPDPILTPDTDEQMVTQGMTYDYYMTITNGALLPDSFDLSTQSYALFADFEGTFPPTGWTVIDNEGTGVEWMRNDAWPEGNYIDNGGVYTACVSSDRWGVDEFDTELWTPSFNLVGAASASLDYDVNYQNFAGSDFLDVDVSTDGGGSWTNLLSWNEDHGGFRSTPSEHVNIDLAAYLGQADVIIRWHYYDPNVADYDWYVEVDNVMVSKTAPPSSNLFEDFEGAFPPAGWTVLDPDTNGGWQQAAADENGNPPPDGTLGAYVRYEMGYNSDEWLISPTFAVGNSAQLTYDWIWRSDWATGWSEGYVLGSTDGGATWPNLVYTFPNNAAWSTGTHAWDISAWADGQANVAIAFHYVSVDDDWWWMIDNVEVTSTTSWDVSIWNLAGTMQITQIGPLASGASQNFRVRVLAPPGSQGQQWYTHVTAASQTDGAFTDTSYLTTYSVNTLWFDDFEDGDVSDWTENDLGGGDGGVANYVPGQGCNSGVWSMFTRWDPVEMVSPVTPLNGLSNAGVGYWVQKGNWPWSEDPDNNEDLIVEYLNNGAAWIQLDLFPGGPPYDGPSWTVLHQLPADALHAGFQLRFRQTGGSGVDYDYWHIDDVQLIEGVVIETSHNPTVIISEINDPVLPINPSGSGGGSPTADPVEPIIVEEVIEPEVEEIPEEPVTEDVQEEPEIEVDETEPEIILDITEPVDPTDDVEPETQDRSTTMQEGESQTVGFPLWILFITLALLSIAGLLLVKRKRS